ncbi:SCP-like protein [Ancylostoma ceylanicum]|uniref:SCP-like protein n=1 Tax=Ancylostoma ceylanicum TaxID=53326 RepID=A0A0D6LE91_9BILA|nr:SCP-like protein [Ancylostoma ceylanicum]
MTSVVSVILVFAAVQLFSDGLASGTEFGCKNAMIADEWREMVLNLHNNLRKKLARGTVKGQAANLPYGKNIKQLYWDCTLEEMARVEAEKCPAAAPTSQTFGISFDTGNTAQTNLYTNGADTEICADCTANTCVDALCNVAPAAVAPVDALCQGAGNTQKALMTDSLRNQALQMHNYYRRLLASGWAKDKKIMYAKPSKAMPELTYDCDMEEKIMLHLKDCAGTQATTNVAENFQSSGDFKSPREDVLEKASFVHMVKRQYSAIQDWWSPLESIGIEDNLYTSEVESSALKSYVPMAHQLTTKVGCGVQTCDKLGKTLVQCAYTGAPYVF